METVLDLVVSFFYNDFILIPFFRKILGEKYSLKITICGTTVLWISQLFSKILPFFYIGVQITAVLNVIIIVLSIIYLQIFFQSSFGKKMLSLVLVMLVQMTMDVLGLKITSMFLGYYEFLDKDSVFTAIGAGISAVLITAGIYGLYRFWIIVEKVQWNFRRNQWFCLILPLRSLLLFSRQR